MKRILLIVCVVANTMAVCAASLCNSSSAGVRLDTTSGTRTAAASETIRYGATWETTASGATAVVVVNGSTLKSATGTGSVVWTPTRNGTYTLTHKVMNGTTQVGNTLTVTFSVAGLYPAAVTVSPATGTMFEGTQAVSLTCATADATIRYTTDGSTPTASSTAYSEPFTITRSTTVKARAFYENGDGSPSTTTATYTLKTPTAPTANPISGTKFVDEQQVVLTGSAGTTIHYTLDGSVPTTASAVYEGPITVTATTTINAIAVNADGTVGEMFEGTYFLNQTPPPVFSPVNGTTFAGSLTVNIACPDPDAAIYYTTDGTEPTMASSVYKRFKITARTVVKAIAYVEGQAVSEVATAEYALGTCADPVVSLADGTIFQHSNQEVSIAWDNTDGVLRYTLDGTEPTAESLVYAGPFTISETTTVKAKVFGKDYFDSGVVSAKLIREWLKVATPVITAAASFSGSKTSVSIACTTADAVVRYTTDGSEPNSHSAQYAGPFAVTATTVVKAYATLSDYATSDTATFTVTKAWGIGDALNLPDQTFSTDAMTGWVRDTTVSRDGSESMRSGATANSTLLGTYAESELSTVVTGNGKVSFWWKASTENDEEHEWDHAEFRVDGTVVARINGETGWTEVAYEIDSAGDHVLSWVYLKDDYGSEGSDCAWVDQVVWTPDPVPALGVAPTAAELAAALSGSADARLAEKLTDGTKYNDYRAWVDKIAGTDNVQRQAIKDSDQAWLSYALDLSEVLETAPMAGDLQIDALDATVEAGRYMLTVSVKDIAVGVGATAVNLADVFGVEGATVLDGTFVTDAVSFTFGVPTDGKVKIIAGPKDTTTDSFFLKVKMVP